MMSAAVTARERMIVSTGMVLLVLLVLTGARLVALLPAALDAPADAVLGGEAASEEWYGPALLFVARHHRAAAGLIFIVGVLGMVLRTGVSLRTLDFLYNDSDRAEGRGFLAFLIDTLSMAAQLALVIAMLAAATGPRPEVTPALLLVLFAVNGVWLCWLGLRRCGEERERLRGLWRAGLLSLLFAAGLGAYLWYWGLDSTTAASIDPALRSTTQAGVAGVAMILLCVTEVYVQTLTYSRKRGKPFVRYVAAVVLALILLALAGKIAYEQVEARGDRGGNAPRATGGTRP